MERALLQARQLIESTMSEHRRRVSRDSSAAVELFENGDARSPELMIRQARSSVSIAIGVGAGPAPDVPPLLGGLPAITRPGVTARLLCGPRALGVPAVREVVRRTVGWEVRLVSTVLREVAVIDGRTALVQSGRELPGRISVVREPTAVRSMEILFAGAWANAEPLNRGQRFGPNATSQSARRILEHLRSGRTDESAAQELGVSVRTYRRHVADLMRELGAKSRFQAGARAVELGLLARGD